MERGRKLATAGVLIWVAETIIFAMFFPQSKIEPYFDGASQLIFVTGLLISHFAMAEYLYIDNAERELMSMEEDITEEELRLIAQKIVKDVYGEK